MNRNELYIKTIFCCMACDGEIAKEELSLVNEMASKQEFFKDINVGEKINEYVSAINKSGALFLSKHPIKYTL